LLRWIVPLVAFVVVLAAQRLFELHRSRRNAAVLRARGATEYGSGHFPMFVVLHVFFPLALIAEVAWLGARPGPAWPLWLALWLTAQALRWSAMRALGEFWNVRVLVLAGAPPIRRGPYRWLRHPNYLAVAVEFVAAPMMFGAWRTAIVCSLLNLVALAIRIPVEERSLGLAPREAPPRR
jgi:methyltransferase